MTPANASFIREPPLPPPSKGFADRSYVMIGFHYGFSGKVDFHPGEVDLASTLGVNLRGDVPIEKYLVLGPLFQFGAWRPAHPSDTTYSYYFDIDLYVRGRLPITTSSTNFQIWAGVPIGLTFNMLGSSYISTLSGAAIGWNVGVLAGAAVHFSPKIGLFSEIGWLQHKFTHSGDPESLYVRISQMNFNVGFVFPQ
jgi:hypothetical protein